MKFLLASLLLIFNQAASSELTPHAVFSGYLVETSVCGSTTYASLAISNITHEQIEIIGTRKTRFFVDANHEADLQHTESDGEWRNEPIIEERNGPFDKLTIAPGTTETIYVRWGEPNFFWYPPDTKFRYKLTLTNGTGIYTEEFRIHDNFREAKFEHISGTLNRCPFNT